MTYGRVTPPPLMTRSEVHAWWSTLACTWGMLWFAFLTVLVDPGPNAPGFIQSAPIAVSSLTGGLAIIWLFRISYLAGKRRGQGGRP